MKSPHRIGLPLLALALFGAARAEEAAGQWTGQLASGFKVRLQIVKAAGGYSASLTNPSGNVIVIDQIGSDGQQLHFGVSKLGLRYEGVWDEQHASWDGKLAFQGSHPLNLRRATAAELLPVVRRRPQEDAIKAGPLPYTEQKVVFDNKVAQITLAATLSLPSGKGPFPAVVFVSGTGPNTRDEDVSGHQCFLVLADTLTRHGIAVLRYDKRGVGGSTGNYGAATTADFAADADAAVSLLQKDVRIDPQQIGLLGHSEGGVIAPMVAARQSGLAFVVMIGSPGIRGDKLFVMQSAATAKAYGVPDEHIARRKLFDQTLYDAVIAAPSAQAARTGAKVLVAQGFADKIIDAGEVDVLPMDTTTPWERYFLAYDPAPALRKMRMPVLALIGSLDLQVPARENLMAIRAALKDHPDATVTELPGMNHLLQRARTGAPNEYQEIDETMSPAALKIITDWVTAHTRPAPL